jgi:GT2 family glycosyltransferase
MNCSIIIVSYNSVDYLRSCLKSIEYYASTAEVIVVDNCSNDGSPDMVRTQFPMTKLLLPHENIGFSAANNLAAKSASKDYIFLLNPDTELTKPGIDSMIHFLTQKNEGCLVGPALLNSDGTQQNSVLDFPTLKAVFWEIFFLHTIFNRAKNSCISSKIPLEVNAISGAAIMMRKDLYLSLGGLDETLFWVEDLDLCYRSKIQGAKTYFDPNTTIIHHGGKSSEKVRPRVIANQLMSRLKYFKKHRSKTINLIAIFLVGIHIVSRLVFLFILQFFWTKAKNRFTAYKFTLKHFLKYVSHQDTKIIL